MHASTIANMATDFHPMHSMCAYRFANQTAIMPNVWRRTNANATMRATKNPSHPQMARLAHMCAARFVIQLPIVQMASAFHPRAFAIAFRRINKIITMYCQKNHLPRQFQMMDSRFLIGRSNCSYHR